MKSGVNNRLNIFIDETGEFGFKKTSAKLYGISLVFHEQKDSIATPIKTLERRLDALNFYGMIHMGDLVTGHGDYVNMTVEGRKKIYNCLFRFSVQVKAKYYSIFIEKNMSNSSRLLQSAIRRELKDLVSRNMDYLQKFSEVKVYYDGGQSQLNSVIDEVFGIFSGYNRESEFDHLEKKLFQVADMLTYVDKILYKYRHRAKLSPTERRFFSIKNIKTTTAELKHHRFN